MATPPRVTTTELRQHLKWIITRRVKVDDPHRDRLPDDPSQADPRDVLDYLARFSGGEVPRWVRQADVIDGLALNVWLWWEDRRRELATLRRGVHLGLFLADMGTPLGIKSRQGTQDRLDRLTALLRYDRPDEKLTREERRIAASGRDPRQAWIEANAAGLAEVTGRVLAAAAQHQVAGDWLEELAADHAGRAWSPASLSVLGLATGEIRTAPAVLDLDAVHNVHRVLRAADLLRARFAQVS